MRMRRGLLISIEGIDASGKTTQAKLLAEELISLGLDVLLSTEPTDGPIGALIKKLLRGEKRPPPVVEAVLFALDRFWHVERIVRPAIGEGKIVVLDRYYHSSLAYQGSAGLDMGWLKTINSFAPRPDLAIYIDVRPEEALKRIGKPRTVLEHASIQEAVRRAYLSLVSAGELVMVNGERSIEAVAEDILATVKKALEQHGLLCAGRDQRTA